MARILIIYVLFISDVVVISTEIATTRSPSADHRTPRRGIHVCIAPRLARDSRRAWDTGERSRAHTPDPLPIGADRRAFRANVRMARPLGIPSVHSIAGIELLEGGIRDRLAILQNPVPAPRAAAVGDVRDQPQPLLKVGTAARTHCRRHITPHNAPFCVLGTHMRGQRFAGVKRTYCKGNVTTHSRSSLQLGRSVTRGSAPYPASSSTTVTIKDSRH